jgi:hypothetical protein
MEPAVTRVVQRVTVSQSVNVKNGSVPATVAVAAPVAGER